MNISDVLSPRSVVVVGGSLDPSTWGGRVTLKLRRLSPSVDVALVNKRQVSGGELVSVTRIADLPREYDQALIAAPAPKVAGLVREAADAGVRSVVVFSSGFGESTAAGAEDLEAELRGAAEDTGVALLGPNCLGYNVVLDSGEVLAATSTTVLDGVGLDGEPVVPAPIAIVTQSGGVGAMTQGRLIEMGRHPAAVVHTGNEYGLSLQEVVAGLATDPGIRTVGVYLEGVRRREDLVVLAETCRANETNLVALIGGRSEAGSRAIMSHSGRMVVAGRATQLLAADLGIPLARDLREFAVALASTVGDFGPVGARVGVVTASGGLGTVVADLAAECGFRLPELARSTQEELSGLMPSYASVRNPVDVTGMLLRNPEALSGSLRAVAADESVDSVVVALGAMEAYADLIVDGMEKAIRQGGGTPVSVLWPQGPARAFDRLRALGTPVFESASELLGILSHRRGLDSGRHGGAVPTAGATTSDAVDLLTEGYAAGRGTSEVFAKEVLETLGLRTPSRALVTTADAAVEAAARIDGPLALKGHGAGLVHKEEMGLVRLGVRGEAAITEAFGSIADVLDSGGTPVEVLVEELIDVDAEFMIGWTRTAVGTVVLFGTGGTGAEYIDDVSAALLPIDRSDAARLVAATVVGRTLEVRHPGAVDRVLDTVVAVAGLAEATGDVPLDLDVNPVAVTTGGGLVALDACFSPNAPSSINGEGTRR